MDLANISFSMVSACFRKRRSALCFSKKALAFGERLLAPRRSRVYSMIGGIFWARGFSTQSISSVFRLGAIAAFDRVGGGRQST